MSTYKYKSRKASEETVRRFFANSPDSDSLSLDEIFIATGRQNKSEDRNRAWLANLSTHLYYHNLLKPVYSYDEGRKKLKGMQLTLDGKRALGRVDADNVPAADVANPGGKVTSLNDVAQAVKEFQDNNPEFDVVFDVKFRGVPMGR